MPRKKIIIPTQGNIIKFEIGNAGRYNNIPTICSQVKRFRISSGMEQKELAQKIGVTANAVSNWENGRSRPDVNLLPLICEALQITLYELFDVSEPAKPLTAREQMLIDDYNQLSQGHKHAVDQLIETLQKVEMAESCPDLLKMTRFDRPLAAGIGDPTEFDDEGESVYVYRTPDTMRADCIFEVSGDSMEPVFHDGQDVLVKRSLNGQPLRFGEIGAFMIANETYIKEYQDDGLHSFNKKYKVMHFTDDDQVMIVGKVIGVLNPECYARQMDIEKYEMIHEDD